MKLEQARRLIIHLICTDQRQAAEALAAKVRKAVKAHNATKGKKVA